MCVASHNPPVPLTVKLPLPVSALTWIPFVGPDAAVPALILVNVNAPVPVAMLTAWPVVVPTVPKEKLPAPVLDVVTAVPVVVVTLPNVKLPVVVLTFTPAPVPVPVMLPNVKFVAPELFTVSIVPDVAELIVLNVAVLVKLAPMRTPL